MLFDLSSQVNNIKDHDKLPYIRSFALSLKFVEKELGVGITNLDLWNQNETNAYDLSTAIFVPSGSSAVEVKLDAAEVNGYRFKKCEFER